MNAKPSDASSRHDPGATPAPTRAPGKGIPPKVLWIGGAALGAVLSVFIAWQVGKFQSRGEVDRLTAELISADARLNALEARRLIHRATLQLESRNFGSAQQLVDEAKQFLAASENGVGGEAAAKLLAELEAFETNVDPNVGKQVAKLVQLAQGLDDLVPAPERPHGVESAPPSPTPPPQEGEGESNEPAPQ